MTPEGKVLASIIRYLKKLKKEGRNVWWLKIHGSAAQRAGIPDLVVVFSSQIYRARYTYWLEVKRPGGKPTKLQVETMRQIEAAGGSTMVVDDVSQVKELLEGP